MWIFRFGAVYGVLILDEVSARLKWGLTAKDALALNGPAASPLPRERDPLGTRFSRVKLRSFLENGQRPLSLVLLYSIFESTGRVQPARIGCGPSL